MKVILVISVVMILGISASEIDLDELEKVNFVVGVARIGSEYDNSSSQCGYELNRFLESIQRKDMWAMKSNVGYIMDNLGLLYWCCNN